MLLDLLFSVIDVLVSLVLDVDDLLGSLVGLLGSLSLLDHAVNVRVRETSAGADGDLLRLSSGLVLCADVHDTVGIDVESDLNLRDTARGHGDAGQVEVTELLVVLGELALTLEHSDTDLGLVVSGSGENLTLLGWNRRVSVDQSSEDASHGLDTEGQGSDIEQENILDVTSEDSTLNSCTDSDSLVWVNTTVWLFVEEVLNGFADLGDTARATDHEYFVDLILGQG